MDVCPNADTPCKILLWLKENIVALGIMYFSMPVGSEKDCFLRETIASCNNWNMTHDEMEISLALILLKIGLTGPGRVERVSDELPILLNVIRGRVVTDTVQ